MKLNYKKTGTGEPLIILHGLFGSADNWFSIAKELEKNYTLYLLDQRNHGDSPHSEEWNYQVMAEDVKELMDNENIESAFLMGHSMGGKTVMAFALQYPEKVKKLIVADIAPRYYPLHHQVILEGLNAIPMDQIKSRKDADDILSKYVSNIGIRQFLLKSLGRNDSKGDLNGRSISKRSLRKLRL
jgi:esterase